MNLPLTLAATTFLITGLVHGQTQPFAAWTHRAPVEASAPGLTRVEIPSAVLDLSGTRSDTAPLRDLRLLGSDGVETPFLIAWPKIRPERIVAAERFKAALDGNSTVLEIHVPDGVAVEEARLQTGHRDFVKAATLEGTLDGAQWEVISDRELIFRQGGSERLRLPVAPGAWKILRITLDDRRSGPVGFAGASFLASGTDTASTDIEEVRVVSREELKGETLLNLDLGSRNRHLHSLRVGSMDPLFQREVKLELPRAEDDTSKVVAQGRIYRVALDDRRSEELELPHRQFVPDRAIMLRILNGNSPPLRIEKVEGRFTRLSLVFHAQEPGTWHLLTGNANAASPQYDVAGLLGDLSKSRISTAIAGMVEPNPGFDREATLPEAGEGGAALDVSAWAYRKPVEFAGAGVLSVELDAEVLAHATPDLRDVRIMQESRQLPYLIERNLPHREVQVDFQLEPDPKRPSVSRWRVELPFAGYPMTRLIADSSTSLFERRVRLWEDAKDDYANSYRRAMGDAAWQRAPDRSGRPLEMHVTSRPRSNAVYLETDNGDNAPVQISTMRVAYAPVNAVFKVAGSAPVQIVYGNARASAPRYDIQLVRAQFENASRTVGTLGAEARTDAYREPDTEARGVGSAWLWAALALVVGGLLWIVSKLLPSENMSP